MKKLLFILLGVAALSSCEFDSESTSSETGTGGSLARFTIKGDYLYAVDYSNLSTYNIADPTSITLSEKTNVGFGVETIFPYNDLLFLGAENGMYIYSLSNMASPRQVSFTSHIRSYDPVVVQGDYAYVTLRSNNGWWSSRNELQIYNISNLNSPSLLKTYPMDGPQGLGISGNKLFVCDNGLKVFSITDGIYLDLIKYFPIDAIDVIPQEQHLYVIASNGLYQYEYSNDNITEISRLILTN